MKVAVISSPKHFDLMKKRGADLVYDYVSRFHLNDIPYQSDKPSVIPVSANVSEQTSEQASPESSTQYRPNPQPPYAPKS
jgi:hypothetical protein